MPEGKEDLCVNMNHSITVVTIAAPPPFLP